MALVLSGCVGATSTRASLEPAGPSAVAEAGAGADIDSRAAARGRAMELDAAAVAPDGPLAPLTGHCDTATVAAAGGSVGLADAACEADRDVERDLAGRMIQSTAREILKRARQDHIAGRIAEAHAGYTRAIERDAELAGRGFVELLAHANRGMLRLETGDDAGALADFRWVLDQKPTKSIRATTHHNLALVQLRLGDPDAALASAKRAKKLLVRELGARHAGVAHVLHSMGVIEAERGELKEAERLLQRAVQLRKATLGDEHPHTAASLTSLGVAQGRQGRWADALEAHEAALDIDARVLGPQHATTAADHAYVGACRLELGDVAGARASFETARSILTPLRDANDPELQRLESWIARAN